MLKAKIGRGEVVRKKRGKKASLGAQYPGQKLQIPRGVIEEARGGNKSSKSLANSGAGWGGLGKESSRFKIAGEWELNHSFVCGGTSKQKKRDVGGKTKNTTESSKGQGFVLLRGETGGGGLQNVLEGEGGLGGGGNWGAGKKKKKQEKKKKRKKKKKQKKKSSNSHRISTGKKKRGEEDEHGGENYVNLQRNGLPHLEKQKWSRNRLVNAEVIHGGVLTNSRWRGGGRDGELGAKKVHFGFKKITRGGRELGQVRHRPETYEERGRAEKMAQIRRKKSQSKLWG